MKPTLMFLITFCSFLIPASAQTAEPATSPTPFEQELISAEKSFIAAAKKGDPEFFKQTLTSDFQFVAFDGELADREDLLDGFSSGGLDILAYDMKVIHVTDDVGIVSYDVVLRVPPEEDQGPPPRYQHFSTTWVKQGDAWKMKFQQMTISHYGDW